MTTVQDYMERDHARLDALLANSIESNFEAAIYNEFRSGLLRHISIEEKLLFPLLRTNADLTTQLAQLRLHHGALGALLVPKGTLKIASAIQHILETHNALEEGDAGVYAKLALSKEDDSDLARKLEVFPAVPLSSGMDKLENLAPVRRAMERAGFDASQYLGEN